MLATYPGWRIPPPGACVLPTGTLEPGETILAALHREVLEETGATAQADLFLGGWIMTFAWGGQQYHKTVLWHRMRLISLDESARAAGDDEAGAAIEWLDVEAAISIFADRGRRLGDWDYSQPAARLLSSCS